MLQQSTLDAEQVHLRCADSMGRQLFHHHEANGRDMQV